MNIRRKHSPRPTFLNKARALEDVAQALKLSQSPNVVLNCAIALAIVGEDARAAKLADEIAQKRPYDTLVQFVDDAAGQGAD